MTVDERALNLHFSSLVFDAHVDAILHWVDDGEDLGSSTTGQVDLPRMKAGNLTAAFFACWVDARFAHQGKSIQRALALIDGVKQFCRHYSTDVELAYTASDVRRIAGTKKHAIILSIEGGHAIEDDLRVLRQYYDLGVRSLTLTHFNSNNWADSSTDTPRHGGLADFGRDVIREMNRIGMIVDVSHVSDKAFWDVVAATSAPIIASHSGAWTICAHPRNMKDDMLRVVGQTGGVVCVSFWPPHISESYYREEERLKREKLNEECDLEKLHAHALPGSYMSTTESLARAKEELNHRYVALSWVNSRRPASIDSRTWPISLPLIENLLDHFDHIVSVAGVDHVGIGSDMNGFAPSPMGLEDCSRLPALTAGLLQRGYSEADVRKILGENVLRVIGDVTER